MSNKAEKTAKPKRVTVVASLTEAEHEALQDIRFSRRVERLRDVVSEAVREYIAKYGTVGK